jgi:hypothetical protein
VERSAFEGGHILKEVYLFVALKQFGLVLISGASAASQGQKYFSERAFLCHLDLVRMLTHVDLVRMRKITRGGSF